MLAVSAHLTGRDRELVRLVARHRVLTTDQLAALRFSNLTTARHRLAVLVRLGVVRRFRPHRESGSGPWHYVLGPVGAALLGQEDRNGKRWLPQVRADRQLALERSQRLRHMTGASWFFVALAAHARAGGGELREWLNETETARSYQDRIFVRPDDWNRLPNPDGLGTWAEAGREVTFWLEYDTGTEHLSRLAAKLDGYAILADALASAEPAGYACPPLLFCLPSPRREQSARRALAGHPDADKLRIATAAIDLRTTCPAGPTWLPLNQTSGPVHLIDLETVVPDPWQGYRDERARKRRQAIDEERARLLEAGWDQDAAAALAEQTVDQGYRRF